MIFVIFVKNYDKKLENILKDLKDIKFLLFLFLLNAYLLLVIAYMSNMKQKYNLHSYLGYDTLISYPRQANMVHIP